MGRNTFVQSASKRAVWVKKPFLSTGDRSHKPLFTCSGAIGAQLELGPTSQFFSAAKHAQSREADLYWVMLLLECFRTICNGNRFVVTLMSLTHVQRMSHRQVLFVPCVAAYLLRTEKFSEFFCPNVLAYQHLVPSEGIF